MKSSEKGPTVYPPYARKPESLFADVITKAAQLFKDPGSWFGQGLNPQPPVQ